MYITHNYYYFISNFPKKIPSPNQILFSNAVSQYLPLHVKLSKSAPTPKSVILGHNKKQGVEKIIAMTLCQQKLGFAVLDIY